MPSLAPGVTLASVDSVDALQFDDHYVLDGEIGRGSFGLVYRCKHKDSGEEFAVKIIDRKKLSERKHKIVIREVSILRSCFDVENIVRLIDFFRSDDSFYVVQVYAAGGDLFERLAGTTNYDEKIARDLAFNLLSTIQKLHERRIAHRDLKPENLLLADMIDDTKILVADFGLATYVPSEGLSTRCGTPAFLAPEIMSRTCRYDELVDMWSVGCLLYMLLGGYPPFQDKNQKALFRKIRGGDFCFHQATWGNVSIEAKKLIANLLVVDPTHRVTSRQAVESKWFKLTTNQLRQNNLSASLGEIRAFNARRQLKGAVYATMLMNRNNLSSKNTVYGDGGKQNNADVALSHHFHDVYELRYTIQSNQTCDWWECINKKTLEIFDVKIVNRFQPDAVTVNGRSVVEAVMHEAAILDSLTHKYIVQFIDFFEEDDAFYLVKERMRGGDVYHRLSLERKYTEVRAREIARILLEAVAYLHDEGVAHRDLKPQNLLLKSERSDGLDIKIADFSFACRVRTPQSLTTRCGTPTYVAPEILKNVPYDQAVDMWSVGVIIHVLLCGYPPFADENQQNLFRRIRIGDWSFNMEDWSHISTEAKILIKKLLVCNPRQRWTAKEALASPWFTANIADTDLSSSLKTVKRRQSVVLDRRRRTTVLRSSLPASALAAFARDVVPEESEDEESSLDTVEPSDFKYQDEVSVTRFAIEPELA